MRHVAHASANQARFHQFAAVIEMEDYIAGKMG
jgi:hypothetical protein